MLRNLRVWCTAMDVEVMRALYTHDVPDEVISLKGVSTYLNGAQASAF